MKTGFNWLHISGLLETIDPETVCVLDQGLVQAVWSIMLSADRDRCASFRRLLVSTLSRFDTVLIVTVDISVETARDRLAARTGDRTRISPSGSGYSVDTAVDVMERVQSLVDDVAPTVGIERLSVRNETPSDLERNTDLLVEHVSALPSVDGSL